MVIHSNCESIENSFNKMTKENTTWQPPELLVILKLIGVIKDRIPRREKFRVST